MRVTATAGFVGALLVCGFLVPGLARAGDGQTGDAHPHDEEHAAPPARIPAELLGTTPTDIEAVLRRQDTSGLAANMAVRGEIVALVKQVADTLHRDIGARVYLVMLAHSTDPTPFVALYDKLGMANRDVLVVSDGARWHLRSSALPDTQVRLLERQADELDMLTPQSCFAVIAAAIRGWHKADSPIAQPRSQPEKPTLLQHGPSADSAPWPLLPFAVGTLVGGLLLGIGVLIGRYKA